MKTLVLIRHGKSSWAFADLSDEERPLKKRGVSDGRLMLDQLKQYKWDFPMAISSPAKRANSTAQIVCQGLGIEITIDKRLYFEGEDAILEAIVEHGTDANTVFCFGHQPNTASLYARLSGNGLDHIPTTGVSIIDFEMASWTAIFETKGNTRALLFPKMFK